MAEFVIKMADERGRVLEQTEIGSSAAEIRDHFASQGYLVYSVKPQGLLAGGVLPFGRKKVKLEEFIIFNQQFITLFKAGLPILTALDLLAKRQKSKYFQGLLEDVRDRVKGGSLLSDAFAAQNAFPKLYTTTILAGEKSGNLEEVLGRFISYQRLIMTFRKKLMVSLTYPALLVGMVILMVTFLITYVVPQFAKLFEDMHAKLPAITQFMLALGVGAQKYVVFFFLGIAGLIFLFERWRRSDAGSEQMDRFIMRLPVLGPIWLKYQVATFSRMMSTLLQGGLPLVSGMETAAQSMGSRLMQRAVAAAGREVRQGQPLSESIERQKLFPDLAVEMMEVGESTGALPAMLNSVAEFFEEDVQTALGAAMALIEPVLLIIMAVVVGTVLISLYMPIFTLGAGGQQ